MFLCPTSGVIMLNFVLTAEFLRTIVDYDPDTGVFRWKSRTSNRVKIGDIAGYQRKGQSYLVIGIKGSTYLAHRLAWLHTHGSWPEAMIDHLNGDHQDNRIANLRDVSNRLNRQNMRKAMPGNKIGILGVHQDRRTGKFIAKIQSDGKTKHIGVFDSPELARDAYVQAKRLIHEACTL